MNEKTDSTADNNIADTASEIEPMRILKIATCPSLSGRSKLTYHVGCDKRNAIHFRLWANTAAGMFSSTWFSMKEVSELLSSTDGITSAALSPLWESTSRNNAGFTLAILMGEGLIDRSVSKPGTYATANPAPFLQRINALITSGVDLDPDDEPSDALPNAALEVPKRGRPKKQAA